MKIEHYNFTVEMLSIKAYLILAFWLHASVGSFSRRVSRASSSAPSIDEISLDGHGEIKVDYSMGTLPRDMTVLHGRVYVTFAAQDAIHVYDIETRTRLPDIHLSNVNSDDPRLWWHDKIFGCPETNSLMVRDWHKTKGMRIWKVDLSNRGKSLLLVEESAEFAETMDVFGTGCRLVLTGIHTNGTTSIRMYNPDGRTLKFFTLPYPIKLKDVIETDDETFLLVTSGRLVVIEMNLDGRGLRALTQNDNIKNSADIRNPASAAMDEYENVFLADIFQNKFVVVNRNLSQSHRILTSEVVTARIQFDEETGFLMAFSPSVPPNVRIYRVIYPAASPADAEFFIHKK